MKIEKICIGIILTYLFFLANIYSSNQLYLFDMGTKDSPVWPGFIKITPETVYQQNIGYGWESIKYLRGIDNSLPDALYGDGISGAGKFLIDLPDGKYRVYMVMRDFGRLPRKSYSVKANGCEVINQKVDSEFYFKEYYWYLDYPYFPGGPDFWEKIGSIPFQSFTYKFETDVSGGQLSLEFQGDCTVNLCIIYPSELSAEVEREILRLNETRKKVFYDKYAKWIKKEETVSLWKPTTVDKNKGYVIFIRNPIKKVYPYSLPQPEEIKDTIEIFAACGEYEPATFSVYALTDLKQCTVKISPLKNEKGDILSDVSIRRVEYLEQIKGYKYSIEPRMLVVSEVTDIPANFTVTYWITIKVPENAQEGIYRGEITFVPGRKFPSSVIKLTLRVLPFVLEEPKDIAFGMFVWTNIPDLYFADRKDIFLNLIEKQIKDMREHGATVIGWGPHWAAPHNVFAPDGSIKVDFVKTTGYPAFETGGLEKYMEILQRVGGFKYFYFNFSFYPNYILTEKNGYPAFSEKFNEAYKEIAKQIRDKFVKEGWPEPVIMVMDEPREFEIPSIDPYFPFGRTKEICKKLNNLIKEVPGLKTSFTLGEDYYIELARICDIPTPHGWDRAIGIIRGTLNNGKTLWLYNNGLNRYSFGFYTWKRGATGNIQWEYCGNFESIKEIFITPFSGVFPIPGGYVATPEWEQVREGIEDYKYIRLLEKYVKQGEVAGISNRIINEAKDLLAEIKSIEETILAKTDKLSPWDVDFTSIFMEECPSDFFDKYKWRIARQIMAINEELKKNK